MRNELINVSDLDYILKPPAILSKDLKWGPIYDSLFNVLVMPDEAKGKVLSSETSKSIKDSESRLNQWLDNPENQKEIFSTISLAVHFFKVHEEKILSESHDLHHVAEMTTSYLDDKSRGVKTNNATLLVSSLIHLMHDTGRKIEKDLSDRQIDLIGGPHHDIFSFIAAKRMMQEVEMNITFPDTVKSDIAFLTLAGLRRFGSIGDPQILATAFEPDRRQLLGSSTVARDMVYMLIHSGAKNKTLSPSLINEWPDGYTHYDSGGFFGQQRTMATGVFKDQSIFHSRDLGNLYDSLAVEAIAVLLLGCGDDETLIKRALSTNYGKKAPGKSLKDENGLIWWPQITLDADILAEANKTKNDIYKLIPDSISLPDATMNLIVSKFLLAYNSLLEPEHVKKVQENLNRLPANEKVRWLRIMFFSHRKNLERYLNRIGVQNEELKNGTFMSGVMEPYINLLEEKMPAINELEKIFDTAVFKS